MSGGQLDTVLRHLRKLVGSPAVEDSDGRLLERFLVRRDEVELPRCWPATAQWSTAYEMTTKWKMKGKNAM